MQRIIHTSDWHLGQRLDQMSRYEEHEAFLSWLLNLIQEQEIDGLIICGDIFDSSNPPASAIYQFNNFIVKARQFCRNVVLIAGNHDSAFRIDSLNPLLNALGIMAVGRFKNSDLSKIDNNIEPDNLSKWIFPLIDNKNQIFARVAGIPYLRPIDLPASNPNENHDQTISRTVSSIAAVYNQAATELFRHKNDSEALLVTGHLFIQGAQPTEGERSIHVSVGKQIGIPSSIFDERIDYVALGHLHRGQKVKGAVPIYYSGSPIPLSFGEADYQHHVCIISVDNGKIKEISTCAVPRAVDMSVLTGTFAELRIILKKLTAEYPKFGTRKIMVRTNIILNEPIPNLREEFLDLTADSHVNIFSIQRVNYQPLTTPEFLQSELKLKEFSPLDVFRLKYQSEYNNAVPPQELENAFLLLLDEIQTNIEESENPL